MVIRGTATGKKNGDQQYRADMASVHICSLVNPRKGIASIRALFRDRIKPCQPPKRKSFQPSDGFECRLRE
jgi:hypothetical protein